jgi:hypothetical protein
MPTSDESVDNSAQPGVGSCTAYNATNPGGGPVLTNPRVNLVFWGSWNTTTADTITSTWQQLSGIPALYSREAEYGIQSGSYGQRFNYPSGATGAHPDCTFAGGLSALLSSANYVPTSNDLFIVFLPSGTSSKLDTDKGYLAHHSSYSYAGWGPTSWNYTDSACSNNTNGACSGATYNSSNNTCTETATQTVYPLNVNGVSYNIRYAIMDNTDLTDLNVYTSHEFAETTTDPDGTSYAEIGDPCEGANQYDFNNSNNYMQGILVQKIWSQAACRCVSLRDLNGASLGGGSSVPTVYRPSNEDVYPLGSPYYFPIYPPSGSADPFLWDHDGDGYPDYAAFYRAPSASVSTRLSSPPYYENTYYWGTTGDRFAPGDYDGDGKSDLAVWRPSNGTWYVQYTSTGQTVTQQWGQSGDMPYPGDFDGDGKTDFAVLRPSTSNIYVIPSATPGSPYWAHFSSFSAGDIPVSGDFNGDGISDFVVYRPSTGVWYVWYMGTSTAYWYGWGQSGDVPAARDYDGDWMTDFTVWRPSNGTWYETYSTTWTTGSQQWGASTDIPAQQSTAAGGF